SGTSGEPGRLRANGQLRTRQRTRATDRLEKAQAAASIALGAASSYLEAEMELPAYFGHLAKTVAGLVGARRVAFWRLAPKGVLMLQREPFGFPAQAPIRTLRIPVTPDGNTVVERIVFRDELDIYDGTSPTLDEFWREHGLSGHHNSIAVSWAAGD